METPSVKDLARGDSYRMAGSNGVPVSLVIMPDGNAWAAISLRLDDSGVPVPSGIIDIRPVYMADWDGAPGDGIWYYVDGSDRAVTLH